MLGALREYRVILGYLNYPTFSLLLRETRVLRTEVPHSRSRFALAGSSRVLLGDKALYIRFSEKRLRIPVRRMSLFGVVGMFYTLRSTANTVNTVNTVNTSLIRQLHVRSHFLVNTPNESSILWST